jgi:hypothetical protein
MKSFCENQSFHYMELKENHIPYRRRIEERWSNIQLADRRSSEKPLVRLLAHYVVVVILSSPN